MANMLPSANQAIVLILVVALVLIVLLLLIYKLILKLLAAHKGKPFSESVTQAAGNTPNSISAVASRAKLDDLRRNFEAGVVKFRAAGKDLYQVPWYVLIGEPGSGKTEAIRHSGIPFPPGLQDQLQGAGGTVNMNWWFTNDAVILDTAGRYLFDEVQPGASSEWTEFLRLLARNRPQCPINGLLLVIPANSLILDTADQIESKAGKIAQQLDRIQRTLDLRFPVFVVVTKCDLINGFREFFDGFNQQSQQHQILGWSNPAPLDEPFNAELVDEHLKTVHTRLMERRLGLLLDPVSREAADGKRTDEVDSLYSLPDSFVRIGPRLRQYLEMVFVAGEWSPKPLFLRGIYFTSSMREGQALDAELAELLGVPVDSLTEGRIWDRDRAFFLKDLFIKKVFPEQGLVTRAVNAGKVERNRKITLLTGGFVSALALLGFTFFGAQQLKQSVSGQANAWKKYQGVVDKDTFAIVKPTKDAATFESQLDSTPPGQNEDPEKFGQIHASLLELEQKDIAVPWVLAPAAGIIDRAVKSADIDANRRLAYQRIYARSVVAPLADAVDKKLAVESSSKWPDAATPALVEMIHLRSQQTPNISALYAYAVSTESAAKYTGYLGKLDAGLKYAQPANGAWPDLVAIDDVSLDAGVAQFIAHWKSTIDDLNGKYKTLADPGGEPDALQAAQANLVAVCQSIANKPAKSLEDYDQNVKSWNVAWLKYDSAYQAVRKSLDKLGPPGTVSLEAQYRAAHKSQTANVSAAYALVLGSFPAVPPAANTAPLTPAAIAELTKLQQSIVTARDQLGSTINNDTSLKLGKYDKSLLTPVAGVSPDAPTQYLFELAHQAYSAANAQFLPPPAPTASPAEAQKVADVRTAARNDVDAIIALLPNSDIKTRNAVMSTCDTLFDTLILPKAHYDDLNARLPENTDSLEELVAKLAADKRPLIPKSFSVPYVNLSVIQSKFNPGVARDVLNRQQGFLNEIAEECARKVKARGGQEVPYTLNGDVLNGRRDDRQREIGKYIVRYTGVYEQLLSDASKPQLQGDLTWDKLQDKSLQDNPSSIMRDNLIDLGRFVADAVKQLPATGSADSERIKSILDKVDLGLEEIKNDHLVDKMSEWRDLGSDPNAARGKIINLPAKEFLGRFLEPVEDGTRQNYVKLYLNQLTLKMLHLLANDRNPPAANIALNKLDQDAFRKFPLRLKASDFISPVPIPGRLDRGLDELRPVMDRVIVPAVIPAGAGDQPKQGETAAIAQGGRVKDLKKDRDTINNDLDILVNGGMNPAGWQRLKDVKALLDVIPRNGDAQLTCKVSVTPEPTQSALLQLYHRLPMKTQFRVIELATNNKVSGQAVFLIPNPGELGPVTTPSDTVRFRVYKTNNAFNAHISDGNIGPWNSDPKLQLQPDDRDPWQSLRFLAGHAVKSPDDSTHRSWDVELEQEVNGVKYSLWVRFQFNKELPDLKNWPE